MVTAAVMLTVAGYAQYRIPLHTSSSAQAALTRIVLVLVGLAFGYVSTAYADTPTNSVLAFLAAFGLVHVPAAMILFLKRVRGDGKS
jgi:hypothetical protein